MTTAILEIKSCLECPYMKAERIYTGDTWEELYDWICKIKENKKIAGSVEWDEVKKIQIPSWCPIKKT